MTVEEGRIDKLWKEVLAGDGDTGATEKILELECKGTFVMEERPYTRIPRREPIGYESDEVRRMGARCLLRDVPTKRQLIEHDWRFDHTISQFVVYL